MAGFSKLYVIGGQGGFKGADGVSIPSSSWCLSVMQQVDRRLVELILTRGGNRWTLVRHVYLPSVAAWVPSNLKVSVGFAFTGAVVGEFVAATRGLGYLLSFAQSTHNSALMFKLVLLIMVVVLVIFAIPGKLERRLLRWN
jgi:NitT/TauT family transport system permease protein